MDHSCTGRHPEARFDAKLSWSFSLNCKWWAGDRDGGDDNKSDDSNGDYDGVRVGIEIMVVIGCGDDSDDHGCDSRDDGGRY